MRRTDRQVTGLEEIKEILNQCRVCRMAMFDGSKSYLVPMNFGYEYHKKLVFYLHSAVEGRKLDIIRSGYNQVCIEVDCEHDLIEGATACAYGYRYASVIGNGTAEIIEDTNEKIAGLLCLMHHQTGREFLINEKMAESVAVIRITIDELTAKRHL